jgi:hypothetical protein
MVGEAYPMLADNASLLASVSLWRKRIHEFSPTTLAKSKTAQSQY